MNFSLVVLSVYMAKSVIVLLFVALMYRLLGKRDLGQFNLFDLVTVIALSNAVQNGMTGGRGELWIGLGSAGSLLGCGYLLSRVFVAAPGAQRAVLGVPVLLLNDGQVIRDHLRREHVSREELMSAIRIHGCEGPQDVAMAVLEVDGSITVVPKGESQRFEGSLY